MHLHLLTASASLDHRCIIVFFTKHLLLGHLPTHRKKQKGEWRTVYNLKACKQEDWDEFRIQVNERLQSNMATSKIPLKSTLSSEKKSLNMKWQIFKDSVLQAAKMTIKTKKRRPTDDNDIPEKLIVFRQHLITLNKIFAFVTKIVHPDTGTGYNRSSTSYSQLQHIWSGRSNKLPLVELYKDITIEFLFSIDNNNISIVISNNTLSHFVTFR